MQDTQDLIPILWKKKRLIIVSAIIAMVLSAIVMLLMPNYYRSTTTFYPVSESLQKPIVDVFDQKLSFYGNDNDVDRLLSISKANELKRELIEEFDLVSHYEIDSQDKKAQLKVNKKFSKLYLTEKTQYDAIEISVEDKDPTIATDIANRARALIEEKVITLTAESRNELVTSLELETKNKKTELNQLTNQIKELREKYGVYDTQSQAESLGALESKNPNSTAIKKRIKDYTQGVSEVKQLETQQEELTKILTYDQNQLNRLKANQSRKSKGLHIIETATMPLEKFRPKRSLYVLGTGILTFLATCLMILIADSLRKMNFDN